MKKLYSLLASMMIACAMFAQPCTKIFFSEYVEGSGNNKALEIYNPTSSAVSLSSYKLIQYNNGKDIATYTLNLDGRSIPAKGVFVIVNSQANADVKAKADTAAGKGLITTNSLMGFNGNDVIALIDTVANDTLDRIGAIGDSTNFLFGSDTAFNHTFVRNASVQQGTKDWSVGTTQWVTYPSDHFSGLGHHLNSCNPSGINDATENFVSIFPNPNNGNFTIEVEAAGNTDVKLYSITGQVVYNDKAFDKIIRVSTSNLNAGLYIVEARSGQKVYRGKIQIQQ